MSRLDGMRAILNSFGAFDALDAAPIGFAIQQRHVHDLPDLPRIEVNSLDFPCTAIVGNKDILPVTERARVRALGKHLESLMGLADESGAAVGLGFHCLPKLPLILGQHNVD